LCSAVGKVSKRGEHLTWVQLVVVTLGFTLAPSAALCTAQNQGSSQVLRLSTAFPYEVLCLSTKPEVPCSELNSKCSTNYSVDVHAALMFMQCCIHKYGPVGGMQIS
jgi:hypothetical protein